MRLRYQWAVSGYNAFVQVGATHTAPSYTQSSANPAQNLTNVIKNTFTSTNQFVVAESSTRPRVIGVNVGCKF